MSNRNSGVSWFSRLFVAAQYPLPQHLLSRIVHWLSRRRAGFIKNFAISAFIRILKVDMRDAQATEISEYASFNEFFTRALKDGTRPLADRGHWLVSPVDGTVSQIGPIHDGQVLQAKGHNYTVQALLGGTDLADDFHDGAFATIYLAPYNYHRIHMPADGTLRFMRLIPGRLFSVNAATAAGVPGLFARNERVVCVFDSANGRFAMILVGAMFVGSIETTWAGEITPGGGREPKDWDYAADGPEAVALERGQEMGRFNMGSTVILLHADRSLPWRDELMAGSTVRLGDALSAGAQEIASQ